MEKMKVLVIGGTGFIGINLSNALLDHGYEVHSISRGDENWKVSKISDSLKIHRSNILDVKDLTSKIEEIKPDGIINASRFGGYGPNEDATDTYLGNIGGILNIFKAAAKMSPWFIQISSSFEYGEKGGMVSENSAAEPISDYGLSKLYSTNIFLKLCKHYGIHGIALRIFQAFGPYEDEGRLLPYILSKIVVGEDIVLKHPKVFRDFIYIDDVNNAVLKAIDKIQHFDEPQVFNLGTGIETSIEEIANISSQVSHSTIKIASTDVNDARREASMKSLVADISKAKKLLEWEPSRNIRSNLYKYYCWMQQNIEHYLRGE